MNRVRFALILCPWRAIFFRFCLPVCALAVCLLHAVATHAANSTWQVASGDWSVSANWSGSAVPNSTSFVFIDNVGTVTISQSGEMCNTLYLGSGSTDVGSIQMILGGFTDSNAYIGDFGTGSFTQAGGTHSVSNELIIGQNSAANSSYILSNGSLAVSGGEYIGNSGTGSFTQYGGTQSISNSGLTLGQGTAGSGSYNMSNGSLAVSGGEYIGVSGTGSFTQYGGTQSISNSGLTLGQGTAGSGSYNMSNGSLAVSGGEYIGVSGTGSFTQNNGTHSISNPGLTLGQGTAGSGSYNMGNGSLAVTSEEYIGVSGTGSFTQSGGTHSAGVLTIGQYSSGNGSYKLGNGLLAVGVEYIGDRGTGSFTQSGGTHSTGVESLYLGYSPGAVGSYNLSNGFLMVYDDEEIGLSGSGSFTQSGGTHYIIHSLGIGQNSGANGSYVLSNGSLAVGEGEAIAGSGSGSFTQSGGTNSVSGGLGIGSSDSYNLINGLLTVSGGEVIGTSGSGIFTQSGGTNSVGFYSLVLGNTPGAGGSYNLCNGLLTASSEDVGGSGSGSFTQSGGTNSVGHLYVSGGKSGSGSYNLSNGLLTATSNEWIGLSGTASFTQTGGMHSVTGGLVLGDSSGAYGSYTLGGGSLVVNQISGGSGRSTFTFNGGLLQASPSANSSFFGGLTSAYIQSGGANINTNGENITLTQALLDGGGGGGLTVYGSGALILLGANTYTGSTSITSGILAIDSPLSGPGGQVSIQPTATLVANASIQRAIAGAAGSQIVATSGNISLGDSTSATGFNHAGTLTIGNNTVTLNSLGPADVGSTTSLNGGTIAAPNGILLNSGFSLVTTQNGGAVSGGSTSLFLNLGNVQGPSSASGNWLTFNMLFKGGTGQSSGRIDFANGYATGDDPGVNYQYGTTMLGGSGTEFDIGGATAGNNSNSYGQLNVALNPNDLNDPANLILAPGTSFNIVDWDGFLPTPGETFTILTWTGSLSGTASLDVDPRFAAEGIQMIPQWNSNSLVLMAVAVPEPATLALLGIGAAGVLGWRWRKRKMSP